MSKFIRKYIVILVVFIAFVCLSACNFEKNTAEAEPVRASVIEIEKYGHAILDITTADFNNHGYELGDVVSVRFGSFEFEMPFYDGYYSNPK